MADMLRIKSVPRFNSNNYSEYIKESLRKNKPYDEFVRELVSSNGLGYKPGNGAAGYYLRDRGMLLDNLSMTMKAFLGTSMECAQCHDRSYDRWSQMDFYKLAAFTSGTKMVISSKNNVKVNKVKPSKLNETIAHALGLPIDKVYDLPNGRPFKVADKGKPILEIF